MKPKMAEAVDLAKLYSPAQVDRALGTAAITGRFADADLLSILDYQVGREAAEPTRASESHSLQPGTSAWASFGQGVTSPAGSSSDTDTTLEDNT